MPPRNAVASVEGFMKPTSLFLLAASLIAANAAERSNFDASWKFARFGAMPDGGRLQEPGAPHVAATASSNEPENPPEHAIDGDANTRWCAASGTEGQSLTVDLGRSAGLGGIDIQWEKQAAYPFRTELSTDGTQWSVLSDWSPGSNASGSDRVEAKGEGRFIRITVGKMATAQWASIREVRLLDATGNPLKPAAPSGKAAVSPAAIDFDDTSWRSLDLPHDWGIEGPFRMDLENETGKLPWTGIGWYRKTFRLEETDRGKQIEIDFDGAMSTATVFVNGQKAGEWAYGYNSFRIDLTPFARFGAENSIAVRLQNKEQSSRWYPGGGIYRHVWLVKSHPVRIAHHGVFARPENISKESADLVIGTEVVRKPSDPSVEIVHELLDPEGRSIATSRRPADGKDTRLTIRKPALWSVENPALHTLKTSLISGKQVLDSHQIQIGLRSAEWKADGFHLNGQRVQIQGVCNHHDLGPLGAAFNTRAAERQIELLKAMGCNSIRTSHNPPAPQLLELCDRMGMLVLDELFDMWKLAKKPNDYHIHFDAWHERDVANFIRRDRNHACVIGWSTGNEIPEQGRKDMFWVSEKLTRLVRQHDPTRQITLGVNHLGTALSGFTDTVDIVGFNYPVKDRSIIEKVRKRRPEVPILVSESSSCVSSRGCYYFPAKWDKNAGFFDFQVSSYELYAPGWANRPDLDFELLERNPGVAGEYVWTGFDYLGEPTPYNQDSTNALNFQNEEDRRKAMEELKRLGNRSPSRSSYFGILDLCGFPKDRYFLYQAHWRPDFPMAHILPHWNWPDRVGQVTPVHVFTSGDEAELFLNGTSLGRKKKEPFQYRIVWEDVIYQPGSLTVKTWKNGKPWAEADRSTTGSASKLVVTADRPEIRADGDDLSYVTVTIADEKNRLVPRSMHRLKFSVDGSATLEAVCNGDATSHEPMQGDTLPAFNGLCQVILRSKPGKPGPATLTVTAEGLPSTKLSIRTR